MSRKTQQAPTEEQIAQVLIAMYRENRVAVVGYEDGRLATRTIVDYVNRAIKKKI